MEPSCVRGYESMGTDELKKGILTVLAVTRINTHIRPLSLALN